MRPQHAELHATGLSKSFGSRTLWHDLDFTIRSGQMVALTGPSGSGKSTLLNCIGLLDRPDNGSIVIDGRDIVRFHAHATRRFRKEQLGYLFQDYALIDNASIEHNLSIALTGVSRRDRRAIIDSALRQVGLERRNREPVYRLSGGEQQRVALARLIVKSPSIILADEPTGALDDGNADMVVRSLRRMAHDGGIVVIATHSSRVADACDRTISL